MPRMSLNLLPPLCWLIEEANSQSNLGMMATRLLTFSPDQSGRERGGGDGGREERGGGIGNTSIAMQIT